MKRKYVYIAAPYTIGKLTDNLRVVIETAETLIYFSQVPFLPHLTAMWDFLHPHEVEFWYDYDLAWLARCDCLLLLPGESVGADKEVALARERGMPVFENVMDCVKWAWT